MQIKTYYEILEVSEFASVETIRAAYRSLSKRFHPDNKKTGNEAKFKLINEAHEHLTDETKKKEYDAELQKSRKPKDAPRAARGSKKSTQPQEAAPPQGVPLFDAQKSVEALFTLGHVAMEHYEVSPLIRTAVAQFQPDLEKLATAALSQVVR